MSQTVYSPGLDGSPDGSRMNSVSSDANQTGPPDGGSLPINPKSNISFGKILVIHSISVSDF